MIIINLNFHHGLSLPYLLSLRQIPIFLQIWIFWRNPNVFLEDFQTDETRVMTMDKNTCTV
jgi:hypothetical protein